MVTMAMNSMKMRTAATALIATVSMTMRAAGMATMATALMAMTSNSQTNATTNQREQFQNREEQRRSGRAGWYRSEEFGDEASGVAAMVFQLGLEMRNDADQQNSLGL